MKLFLHKKLKYKKSNSIIEIIAYDPKNKLWQIDNKQWFSEKEIKKEFEE